MQTEEDRLVKTSTELIEQALMEEGWTAEQIAMWKSDPDAVAALLGE